MQVIRKLSSVNLMGRRAMTLEAPKIGPAPLGLRHTRAPKAQKRVKIYDLDEALVMYKKFKDIVFLRDLLEMSQGHILNVHALGKLRGKYKLSRTQRLTSYPEVHPGVVRLTTDKDGWQWLEFTEEAEDLMAERAQYMREVHEKKVVTWIRKLLMMSQTRRLPLSRLHFLRNVLFLPHDFRTRFIYSYPEYFTVCERRGDRALELTEWDDSLAVTSREQRLKDNALELDELMGDINPYAFPMSFPTGFHLRKKVREYYEEFQKIPFQSPYEISRTPPGTMASEKRNLAIVHEMLSLFVEKRAQISQISAFRVDFNLTPRIRQLVERFQGIFYTSYKEDLFTIFLKEAYSGMRLIDRSPLLEFRDRFIKLCLIEPETAKRICPERDKPENLHRRLIDMSVYKHTVGRMGDDGLVRCKEARKTLTKCLAAGCEVEILGENDDDMVLSKPRIRFENYLEENSGYNITELEKSLDTFKDTPEDWPSDEFGNGDDQKLYEGSDLEW